jgi:hypothetical protein
VICSTGSASNSKSNQGDTAPEPPLSLKKRQQW